MKKPYYHDLSLFFQNLFHGTQYKKYLQNCHQR